MKARAGLDRDGRHQPKDSLGDIEVDFELLQDVEWAPEFILTRS